MKIKALGAAGTVTGSCFQIELEDERRIFLDCGLFQGGRQTELRNTDDRLYEPRKISAIVITHAHMDHSGLVPRMFKDGFNGPVFATKATCDLLQPLWMDAVHIQEQEAQWKSRKNRRLGKKDVEPLYAEDDARKAMSQLTPVDFDVVAEVLPGVKLRYVVAGHILGAASVHFSITENGVEQSVVFSGDLGRTHQLLMSPPSIPPKADTIFMETTYGNRLHKDMGPSIEEFISVIKTACQEKGKVLIPAFAVERTQEIILLLTKAWHDGTIPKDLPIILDSPLALATSEIYADYVNLFDKETRESLAAGISPINMPNFKVTKDAQESQKINDISGSAIIIAGSGMANAGRILHHLKHNLWRPNCHVVFVGFQAQGTTGRRLVEGAKTVKIFRETVNVEAKIHTIGGFSGHADQNELVEWLTPQVHPGLTVNLIHGEASSTRDFYELVRVKFPEVHFNIPEWLHYVALADQGEGETDAAEMPSGRESPVVPSFLHRLERLQNQSGLAGSLSPGKLALLEKYLGEVETILLNDEKSPESDDDFAAG